MAETKQFKLASKRTGRMLCGVLSGISNYTGADVSLLRAGLVAAVLFFGVGLPLYIATWLICWVVCGYDD